MENEVPLPKAPDPDAGDVTGLLLAWSRGDPEAFEALIPLVYDELRRRAERYLAREDAGHTLQPTAVVHETYLRLLEQKRVRWKDRGHFFAVAARMMRRLLVDHARRRDAEKRGGGATRIPLEAVGALPGAADVDVIALDRALERLAVHDPEGARVVELRYFGGLTLVETAEALGSSRATVGRSFRLAKAWLYRELSA